MAFASGYHLTFVNSYCVVEHVATDWCNAKREKWLHFPRFILLLRRSCHVPVQQEGGQQLKGAEDIHGDSSVSPGHKGW